jgi:hypothetical protein
MSNSQLNAKLDENAVRDDNQIVEGPDRNYFYEEAVIPVSLTVRNEPATTVTADCLFVKNGRQVSMMMPKFTLPAAVADQTGITFNVSGNDIPQRFWPCSTDTANSVDAFLEMRGNYVYNNATDNKAVAGGKYNFYTSDHGGLKAGAINIRLSQNGTEASVAPAVSVSTNAQCLTWVAQSAYNTAYSQQLA